MNHKNDAKEPVVWNIGTVLATAGVIFLMVACVFTFLMWGDIQNGNYEMLYIWIGLVVLGIPATIGGIVIGIKKAVATSSYAPSKGSEQSTLTKENTKNSVSINLWAKDEVTAKQLATDQFYLMGVLMGDDSSTAKNFLEALNKGGILSHKVFRDSTKGGYNVEITVTPEA